MIIPFVLVQGSEVDDPKGVCEGHSVPALFMVKSHYLSTDICHYDLLLLAENPSGVSCLRRKL
jgi:hypothetical protein